MQGTSSAGRRWPDFGTWWSIVITHAVTSAWSRRCQTKHWQPYYRPQWRISLQRAVQWAEPRGCVRQQSSKPTGDICHGWNFMQYSHDGRKEPLILTELSCLRWRSSVAWKSMGPAERAPCQLPPCPPASESLCSRLSLLFSVSESEYLDGLRDQK